MKTKVQVMDQGSGERVPLMWVLAAGTCWLAWRLISSLLERSI